MGKAAALLEVQQMCRHSRTMPVESKMLFPDGIQGLTRLLEHGKQPCARISRRPLTRTCFPEKSEGHVSPPEVAAPWHFRILNIS